MRVASWLLLIAGCALAGCGGTSTSHAPQPPDVTTRPAPTTSSALSQPVTSFSPAPSATRTTASPTKSSTPKASSTSSAAASPSLTDPSSIWVIVNKLRPLTPKTYAPSDLTSVGSGQLMRKAAAGSFQAMQAAATAAQLPIYAASSYRSYTYQVGVYDRAVGRLGKARADIVSARPGYSEHQTGWTVDVAGGDSSCVIEVCWEKTAQARWVTANAYRWGFIVRYPQGSQPITGYTYEPWHLRYVGVALATQMHNAKIATLEQWFHLDAAPTYPGDTRVEGAEQPSG